MSGRRAVLAAALAAAWTAVPLAWAADAPPPLLDQIRQRLASEPVVRGQFEQRKSLKGFRNPLVSRGDFLVVRGRGVVWRTREPFASSVIVTRDRLLTRQADGTPATQLNARDEPALRAINETLFALMAADLGVLAQRFRLEGEVRKEGWRLSLVPRDAALARWVASIELEGDRFVRSLRMVEAQGDESSIRFSQQAGTETPTREEDSRFD